MKKLNEAWEMYKKQVFGLVIGGLGVVSVGAVSDGFGLITKTKANPVYVYEQMEANQKQINEKFEAFEDSLSSHSHEIKKTGIRIDSLVSELRHKREMDSLRDAWRDSILKAQHKELLDKLEKR